MNCNNTAIGLASDHTGYELKEVIKSHLEKRKLNYVDFGTHSADNCDYPDFAHQLSHAIETNALERGIALCGTGNGMVITLNKNACVRACLAWNEEVAKLVRAHNKANILVLPARYLNRDDIPALVDAFLDTPFDGGRHIARLNKI